VSRRLFGKLFGAPAERVMFHRLRLDMAALHRAYPPPLTAETWLFRRCASTWIVSGSAPLFLQIQRP
jgi:hypothetical protein